MNYPIVYDCKTTEFDNHGLGALENATDVRVREVINGEFLLSFVLPKTDPKWQYIIEENFIKAYDASQKKDQLFRIRTTEEQRDNTGKLTSNVQCEHVYYDVHDCAFFPSFEMIGETPEAILTTAFAGTRFTIGTIEVTTLTDIMLEKAYPHNIVSQLIENVGGELVKDNWTINLVSKRGVNTGVCFRVGKNIKGIRKHKDAQHIITRLYPYGKDSLQIPGALGYIDSPLINNYDHPKIGHKDYKEIEDPDELLSKAQAEWSTIDVDGIDKPRVTYSGDFLELKKLKEYGEAEAYGIGDTVKIVDTELNINTNQRIMEYENYPYEPNPSMVALSNTNPKVYKDNRTSNKFGGVFDTTKYVNGIKTSSGDIDSGWLDNIRSKLQTEINGMVQKALLHAKADLYVDNLTNPTKALILGPGIFAIANSKKPNGDWNWRTIATGDKIIADEVDANWVYAGVINGNHIIGSKFFGETEHSAYVKVGGISNLGDFSLYRGDTETPIFQIFDGLNAIDFLANLAGGALINFLTTTGSETFPKGVWDCSGASFAYLNNGVSNYATQAWAAQKNINTDSDSHSHTVVIGETTYTTSSNSHSHGQK